MMEESYRKMLSTSKYCGVRNDGTNRSECAEQKCAQMPKIQD